MHRTSGTLRAVILRLLIPIFAVALTASACGGGTDDGDGDDGEPASSTGDDGSGTGGPAPGSGPGSTGADDDGSGAGRAGDPDGGEVLELGSGDVELTSRLIRFDGCDAVLDYIHTEYADRVGPWGFDDGGWGWGVVPRAFPEAMMDVMDDAEMGADVTAAESVSDAGLKATAQTAPAQELVEGVDYSGTNVQEVGVDEADIVKTDGERIFALSDGRLVVTDVASRQVVGSVEVAWGWSGELFISGDGLLLIQRDSYGEDGFGGTVLQRISLSGGTPAVVETVRVEGDYVSARSVGGTARVILRHNPVERFPFVYPQSEAGEQAAENANRAALLNSTLDDWLPRYTSDDTGSADGREQTESDGQQLVGCENVHAPSVFSGFGVAVVMSVPIEGDFDPAAGSTAVMAPGETVYASVGSLYLATTVWQDAEEDQAVAGQTVADDDGQGGDSGSASSDDIAVLLPADTRQDRRTSIHRFDITDTAGAAYQASGDVPGVIHNQFSLSEHEGHLRVVTTTGDEWWIEAETSQSQVRVLRQDGDRLLEVGSVGDIGRGERVQSVRFVGDIGYVVTFRRIDPFYTIDLSDPTNPVIRGELKIPGFSSYLHPIGDGLVLGVGSDADEDGRVTGSKVSLFDVSDLDNPLETAVWTAPSGWNDIGWDHRAFLWWAPESLAVVPVSVYSSVGSWSGAVALRVADGAIAEVGRIDHEDDEAQQGQTQCRRLTPDDLAKAEQALPSDSGSTSNTSTPSGGEDGMDAAPLSDFIVGSLSDSDRAVLACGRDQKVAMTGFNCYEEAHYYKELADSVGLTTSPERLFTCWPSPAHAAIVRSIVISDELWTLSYRPGYGDNAGDGARLQVNSLTSLERLAKLYLNLSG